MIRNTRIWLSILLIMVATATLASGKDRQITFNGRRLTAQQQQRLSELEKQYDTKLPDQAYWYDNRSGLTGLWGGPAAATLPAGLGFGGPMPANASKGGTGVFINGRELHPMDLARLMTVGPVYPSRFWLDANGDFGFENGPTLANLYVLFAEQERRPRRPEIPDPKAFATCGDSGCYYADKPTGTPVQ